MDNDAKQKRLARLKQWKKPAEAKPEVVQIKAPKKRTRLVLEESDLPTPATPQQAEAEHDVAQEDPLESFMRGLTPSGQSLDDDQDLLEVMVRPQEKKAKKAAKIPYVDHKARQYPEIINNFYTGEPRHIPGVVSSRPLAPILRWTEGGFSQQLLDVISSRNFTAPTPIQSAAAAAIMGGSDVLAIAETGSGKTMAYVLPMLRHVQAQTWKLGDGPIAVILSPTRELCVQIYRELEPLAKATNVEACCCYGGSDLKTQIDTLHKGTTRVIVATPGRLIDLLAANKGRVLSTLWTSFVVVDEADRMFDLGFSPQLYRIFNTIRRDRQTVLCSATMSKPMEELASKVLRDPVRVEVGSSGAAAHIEQSLEVPPNKLKRLQQLLDNIRAPDQAIVFTERQESADELGTSLLGQGYKCRSLHGAMSQADRDGAIEDLRAGDLDLLVATSIAARGLDVRTIRLVVNYDPPGHIEDYIHRVGRTGRAGEPGKAVTFFTLGQYKQAHEVIKAFDNSKVPEQIRYMASQFKEQPRERLGFTGKGLDNLHKKEEPVQTLYGWSITLDINDFPAVARKKVLSLSVQQELSERYEVTFTSRGSHNKAGDRLRVVIEATQKESVISAYEDLVAFFEESLESVTKYEM